LACVAATTAEDFFPRARRVLRTALRTRVDYIPARTPILKAHRSPEGGCPYEFDLSFGSLGIAECNWFLRDYCFGVSPYTYPLVAAVKQWACDSGILNSRARLLNSHAVTLLVVHFLQSKGLLPKTVPPEGLKWSSPRPRSRPLPGVPPGFPSVGRLFIEFFDWVVAFPFATTVLAVRQDSVLDRGRHPFFADSTAAWVLEDPVNMAHNVARNISGSNAGAILEQFRTAAALLKAGRLLPSFVRR
jgi:DNA polymerase sigma